MTRLRVFVAVFVTAAAIAIACSDEVLGPDTPMGTHSPPVASEKEATRLRPFIVEERWSDAFPPNAATTHHPQPAQSDQQAGGSSR